ncbi:MAG TPA: alpha/beta fold hydrolase [Longimicrobiales bacterium]|nr:alpha/beta fold hydrolase [Longimicrobiales bacterium]
MGAELSRAEVSGATLTWREAGAGDDVLVLIHGFPFSSAIWRPQLDAPPAGWRVIAPDLRGFGGSGPVTGNRLPMDLLAQDVAALLAHIGVGSAVFCGHSMGGYVTFALMRRAPRLARALVLADTRAAPDSAEAREGRVKNARHVHANGTAALINALVPRLLSASTRETLPHVEQELREVMNAAPAPAVVAALLGMAERPDSTPQLRSINVPTQLIVGATDAITPPGDARLLARAIPGAQIEIIDNAGHLPSLEQPAAFNRVLGAFLERVRQTPLTR